MDDDALSRAKRALQVLPKTGTAVTPVDKAKVNDLLARAREAAKKPPAVIAKETPPAAQLEARPVPANQQPRSAAQNTPTVINHSVRDGHAHVVELPAHAASTPQTVIVNVTTEAAAPAYPYPPYWWWWPGYPAGWACRDPKCPQLRGKRCRECRWG